jgi:hypothetical protein
MPPGYRGPIIKEMGGVSKMETVGVTDYAQKRYKVSGKDKKYISPGGRQIEKEGGGFP